PLAPPTPRPLPHHPHREICELEVGGMLGGVGGEAPAVIEHLPAELPHGLAMLVPDDGARLVDELSAAVAEHAEHDVQIAPAAADRPDVQRHVEPAELLERF